MALGIHSSLCKKTEAEHEVEKRFSECSFSNCKPKICQLVMDNFKKVTLNKFDSYNLDSPKDIDDLYPSRKAPTFKYQWRHFHLNWSNTSIVYSMRKLKILHNIHQATTSAPSKNSKWKKKLEKITLSNIQLLIGGKMLPFQLAMLFNYVEIFGSKEEKLQRKVLPIKKGCQKMKRKESRESEIWLKIFYEKVEIQMDQLVHLCFE
ncbi:hypothetical protein VP01_4191g1 [Puccinia sorghi]|uniref:Uncharacterized protein n=1 Tax=Puccinia sorghi TaxID=27349 RepID=A0A0L6UQT0_9BASI|nr:hypothetical protein VP01_4191g1 [Puccinia sorghi]